MEFGNVGKTQGILYIQVVNPLILKIKDIAIFTAKYFLKIDCDCKGKISCWTGGKKRKFESRI